MSAPKTSMLLESYCGQATLRKVHIGTTSWSMVSKMYIDIRVRVFMHYDTQ